MTYHHSRRAAAVAGEEFVMLLAMGSGLLSLRRIRDFFPPYRRLAMTGVEQESTSATADLWQMQSPTALRTTRQRTTVGSMPSDMGTSASRRASYRDRNHWRHWRLSLWGAVLVGVPVPPLIAQTLARPGQNLPRRTVRGTLGGDSP